MWYSNSLAQWFDIPIIATPTHDEKGTAAKRACRASAGGRESSSSSGLCGASLDLKGLFLALCKTEFILPVGVGRGDVTTTAFKSTLNANRPQKSRS